MDRYEHVQTEPSSLWVVEHPLYTRAPVLDVFVDINGELQKMMPNEVKVINLTTIHIKWTLPRTGKVGVA